MAKRQTNTRSGKRSSGTRSSDDGAAKDFNAGDGIDRLMSEATEALEAGQYIDCELAADDALHRAWKHNAYDLMARIILPLMESRRQRRLQAVDAKHIVEIEHGEALPGGDEEDGERSDETEPVEPGIYLIQPPGVGADARLIRVSALEQRVPVFALAIEPKTQMGLLPVAVVGPSAVRAQLKPPAKKKFNAAWCLEAIDVLTEAALMQIDTTRPLAKQVDLLMDVLDALPESERLHQALADTAQAAHREEMTSSTIAKPKSA